jgi:hypothetical protein
MEAASGRDASGHDAPAVLGHTDSGQGQCTGVHCSSDLHSVLDCSGNVVTACPANEGCSGTTCVAACQAAQDNRTNIGCDYYAVTPDAIKGAAGIGGAEGACYAAFVANTWDTPVTLSVDFNGATLDVSTFAYIPSGTTGTVTYTLLGGSQLPAGQVAILFLNREATGGSSPGESFLSYDCPTGVTPAITTQDTAVHGTGFGNAFHIATDAPVVAYDVYPYGGGHTAVPSATLLLPTSAWDTNYIAVDAYRGNQMAFGSQPWVVFVAMTDNTAVTINPTADVKAATGVAAATKGVPVTYTLNQGQVLELATGQAIEATMPPELTGSIVESTQPIGVWAGMSGLNVDPTNCCTDTAHQQIPPVRSLGHEYVAVRYRNRYTTTGEETPPWRFVGAVDGTTLTYEPSAPSGAPATLNLGQVVEFDAAGPFVVRSQDAQHPFYVAAYMTGAGMYDPAEQDDGGSGLPEDGRGDAEFVNVIPPDEFLQSYIFFTDPTYPETDLVVVRTKGTSGFQDVSLDCAGKLSGWTAIGTSGQYEYTRFDLVTGNFVGTGSCNNGRHQITSSGSFGVTVWGWGSPATGTRTSGIYTQFASYAYPAGASVAPINTVVVPAAPK